MDNRIVLELMKARGYNTSALAQAAGLSVSTVNKIVYGITKNPTLDNIVAISSALGCKVDDLCADSLPDTPVNRFAVILKDLRTASGLSQQELANALNISRSAVSMYEAGVREPGFALLLTIARYFQVDPNYLLGWHN